MKSLIALILLTLSLSAWCQLTPNIHLDYFPGNYIMTIQQPIAMTSGSNSMRVDKGSFRVRVGASYRIEKLSIYFDQHVYMNKSKSYMFQPMQAEWYVGLSYNINAYIKIKAEHLCVHPIKSSGKEETMMMGGYDMLSISYEGR